ncbi:MAG: tetratricopeptide repeat protein, partial [candidate division WOR-3 bacterium]
KAIQDYSTAIELKPDDPKAYNNRGLAYYQKGELDTAIQDFSKAIKLKPDDPEAYNNRGNAYEDQGKLEQAVRDWQKVIELEPELLPEEIIKKIKRFQRSGE